MTTEERKLREAKWRHLRRVKRWLRPLPRRATIHRYPILRWFAKAAKRRAYLWSFREEDVVPAIYAGFILTMLPLFGIQIPLSVGLALILRANLPVLSGLQMISNPITAVPMWFAGYQVGRGVLGILGVEVIPLAKGQIQLMLDHISHGQWGQNFERLVIVFGVTTLGAVVMGIFFGLIVSVSYRIFARRTAASYRLLVSKIQKIKEHRSISDEPNS